MDRSNPHGNINHNGRTIPLTQEAYLAGTDDAPRYEAMAEDDAGNTYRVTWTPYENYKELFAAGDESDCCDWSSYTVTPITENALTDRERLAADLLRDCPAESLDDHKAIAAALLRGDSNEQVLAMDQLDAWPETYSWLKGELGETNSKIARYDIAGQPATAVIGVDDKGDLDQDPKAENIDVEIKLTIAGKTHTVLLQSGTDDGVHANGELEIADRQSGANAEAHDALARELGAVAGEDHRGLEAGEPDYEKLSEMLAGVIEAAQVEYDDYLEINDLEIAHAQSTGMSR